MRCAPSIYCTGDKHKKAQEMPSFGSALEANFYNACIVSRLGDFIKTPQTSDVDLRVDIAPQYPVGRYKLDFLLSMHFGGQCVSCLGVEVDGHEFHQKTKQQVERDRCRDRYIMSQGIPVVRFTGSEVYRDAEACAYEAYTLLRSRSDV